MALNPFNARLTVLAPDSLYPLANTARRFALYVLRSISLIRTSPIAGDNAKSLARFFTSQHSGQFINLLFFLGDFIL